MNGLNTTKINVDTRLSIDDHLEKGLIMNKVHRKIEYSLIALKHMVNKKPGELTTAKEIAETYRSPFDVTARVMQTLAQKGVLKSEQGAHGGYLIQKDLAKLSVLDLIEILNGPSKIVKCQTDREGCEMIDHCNIISPINTLNAKLNHFYQSLNLRDLLLKGTP
jgi:Rrf2 family protein